MSDFTEHLNFIYGEMPPLPEVRASLLHRGINGAFIMPVIETWRLTVNTPIPVVFSVRLMLPVDNTAQEKNEPNLYPVILSGDLCWHYVDDAALRLMREHKLALAQFNRVDIAPDIESQDRSLNRTAAIYNAFPELDFGALMAWAWAYRAVLTALLAHPAINPHRVILTGHSRGGKSALIAGAIDARVWLTHANNSGCLGSGSNHDINPEGETWQKLAAQFPHWVSEKLLQHARQEGAELPFDQDTLLRQILPRKMLITQANGDLWANPNGTKKLFEKIRSHNPQLNEHAELVMREGGHPMCLADWHSLISTANRGMH